MGEDPLPLAALPDLSRFSLLAPPNEPSPSDSPRAERLRRAAAIRRCELEVVAVEVPELVNQRIRTCLAAAGALMLPSVCNAPRNRKCRGVEAPSM